MKDLRKNQSTRFLLETHTHTHSETLNSLWLWFFFYWCAIWTTSNYTKRRNERIPKIRCIIYTDDVSIAHTHIYGVRWEESKRMCECTREGEWEHRPTTTKKTHKIKNSGPCCLNCSIVLNLLHNVQFDRTEIVMKTDKTTSNSNSSSSQQPAALAAATVRVQLKHKKKLVPSSLWEERVRSTHCGYASDVKHKHIKESSIEDMFFQHKYSVTLPFRWNTHTHTLTTQIPTNKPLLLIFILYYKAYKKPPNRIVYKSL